MTKSPESTTSLYYKKPTWNKLLLGNEILKKFKQKNMCYLDTDILINPISPNIF